MLTQEVVGLLVQAARAMLAEREKGKLTPSQWLALRFLARANLFSRTLSGFAQYQATTRGTASQTIKALESDGYIAREKSSRDGRSSILRLTAKGHRALDDDPIGGLVRIIEKLDDCEKIDLRNTLHEVVASLTDGEPRSPVGTCRDCVFLLTRRQRTDSEPASTSNFCKALGLPIDAAETDRLCVSFQPSSGSRRRS